MSNTTDSCFSSALASPLDGRVLVRAIDTNSTNKAQSLNTLNVDQLKLARSSQTAA